MAKNGEKWGPQSKVLANLSKEVGVKISKNPVNPVNPATKTADVSTFFHVTLGASGAFLERYWVGLLNFQRASFKLLLLARK